MKRIRSASIIGLLGLALLAFAYWEQSISQREKSIFEYPESVLQVYSALSQEGLNSEGVAYLAMQDNGEDFVNYWVQGCKCISLLRAYHVERSDGRCLIQAAEIMEKFMDTWERYGKFPRPAYAEFGYGWVSSMDAPTIMVASQMIYELTGEEKYRLFINDLIDYVIKDVSREGFNIMISSGQTWPLEYAASISNAENAKFVLNGSLVGYLGCRIISDFYQSDNLDKYIREVEMCYRNRLTEYRFEKYEWSRYMMNPETVIPPHYMIFEMKLFDAAYELTGRKFYKLEKEFRKSAIKNVLELEFVRTNDKNVRGGVSGKIQYVMHRACAPHPYLIDIYKTEIVFYDKNGSLLQIVKADISGSLSGDQERFYEGAFLCGDVPEDSDYYELYTENEGVRYLLFQEKVSFTEKDGKKTYKTIPDILYDGEYENGQIKIKPDLTESTEVRIVYQLQEPEKLSSDSYYALEIENKSQNELGMGLLLYDTNQTGAFRYYTKIRTGKNLILFSELGFAEINELRNIAEICFRIYTADVTEDMDMEIGKLYKFEGTTELYHYFINSEYKINPQ